MSRPRKVHVKSFGCQMNVYDSHRMADTLAPAGFTETALADDADLVILNTCNIREKAVDKVYSEIGRMRELKEAAAAQGRRDADRGRRLRGAGGRAGNHPARRRGRSGGRLAELSPLARLDRAPAGRAKESSIPNFRSRTSSTCWRRRPRAAIAKRGIAAFVTVQEGCDKFCTFCVVPYTRGAEVSRPVEKIAAEVERLAAAGVREVTLIGQNVNAYHGQGADGRPSTLGQLLRRLAHVPGIVRLRYTTSHPRDMDDDLIAAHGDLPALMPYVHLPVQSGSDRMLAAMNRRHTRKDYLDVIARLRATRPDLAFTSDFIVGFPGETEDDFRDTLTLVDEVGFAGAYTFTYSPRPGTPAAEMVSRVPAGSEHQTPAPAAGRNRPPAARIQCVLCRPHRRGAAGKAGQAPWATGRQNPISTDGAGHGGA